MKNILSILALSILSLVTIDAQEVISLSGKVEDASNGRALGFASVHLAGTTTSNVSNTDGVFVLKIPATYNINDSITVSYLGYKSRKIAVSSFSSGKELVVALSPSVLTLEPITIKPQDAASIVKSALSRVKQNYSQTPKQMTAFYREMIQKGSNYVSINEAVLDILKASYLGYRNDVIGIYKARGNYDINRLDTLFVRFQGGANSAVDLDVMKDPFLGVEPIILHQAYDFTLSNPITLDDKLFYVILFNQKESISDILFRGAIYIESESLAIGRVEFAMNVEGRNDANKIFIRKKPSSLEMDVVSANYLVNYKMIDSTWYFDYSRTEVKFSTKWKRRLFRNNYTIFSEIAITDIKPQEITIDPQSRVRQRDIMSNRVNDFTDEYFWEDYNVIEPEASIERVISRIIRQLKKREN